MRFSPGVIILNIRRVVYGNLCRLLGKNRANPCLWRVSQQVGCVFCFPCHILLFSSRSCQTFRLFPFLCPRSVVVIWWRNRVQDSGGVNEPKKRIRWNRFRPFRFRTQEGLWYRFSLQIPSFCLLHLGDQTSTPPPASSSSISIGGSVKKIIASQFSSRTTKRSADFECLFVHSVTDRGRWLLSCYVTWNPPMNSIRRKGIEEEKVKNKCTLHRMSHLLGLLLSDSSLPGLTWLDLAWGGVQCNNIKCPAIRMRPKTSGRRRRMDTRKESMGRVKIFHGLLLLQLINLQTTTTCTFMFCL